MADKVISFTSESPCACCGGGAGCACALLAQILFNEEEGIDVGTPYSSYAAALAAMTDYVGGCLALSRHTDVVPTSFSAAQSSSTQGTVSMVVNRASMGVWLSFTIGATSDLSIPWVGSTSGGSSPSANAILYPCAGGLDIMSDFDASGTLNLSSIPAGTYILLLDFGATGATSLNVTFTINSTTTIVFNPVIARWDDSGTTRQLEACPKLYVPPLTESSGDWYSSCSSASAELGASVSCIFFIEDGLGSPSEYTASGALVVTRTRVLPTGFGVGGYASINAVGGQTLSFAWTTFTNATVDIYDYAGVLVQSLSGSSSPLVSSALPYTGKYTVKVIISGGSATTSSVTITSLGAISVNPIQALYDVGLDCPARLNCGDECAA